MPARSNAARKAIVPDRRMFGRLRPVRSANERRAIATSSAETASAAGPQLSRTHEVNVVWALRKLLLDAMAKFVSQVADGKVGERATRLPARDLGPLTHQNFEILWKSEVGTHLALADRTSNLCSAANALNSRGIGREPRAQTFADANERNLERRLRICHSNSLVSKQQDLRATRSPRRKMICPCDEGDPT